MLVEFDGARVSAVLFDMDGLMIDTERLARRAWDRAFADDGLIVPDEAHLRAIGRTVKDTLQIWRDALGAHVDVESINARKIRYLEQIYNTEGVPLKPGLRELLDALDAHHVPYAIATSTARTQATLKISKLTVPQKFDVVVCGDEVAHGKPAPDIFLAAARKLATPITKCVVLEDSLAGIRAAHAAGAIPLMVPDIVQPDDATRALARHVFASLHDVRIALFGA